MPNCGVDTHLSMRVPQKILKKSVSLYYMLSFACEVAEKLEELKVEESSSEKVEEKVEEKPSEEESIKEKSDTPVTEE